jgi:hypothetical protein
VLFHAPSSAARVLAYPVGGASGDEVTGDAEVDTLWAARLSSGAQTTEAIGS